MPIDSNKDLVTSSLWGVARGNFVHLLIYPLEVIKIRQQCDPTSHKSTLVAYELFKKEGLGAFYKGLQPQLLKTSIKQFWCWPLMMGIPPRLKKYELGDLQDQAATGLIIATADAAISTPLERAKIRSAFHGKELLSVQKIFQNGWNGFPLHWAKLSVNWITFLTAQKALRDRASAQQEHPLTLAQLATIGTQVALIVSCASAPLDYLNTLKQAKDLKITSRSFQNGLPKFYKGWPLTMLSLVVHNVASVAVIDRLSRQPR